MAKYKWVVNFEVDSSEDAEDEISEAVLAFSSVHSQYLIEESD